MGGGQSSGGGDSHQRAVRRGQLNKEAETLAPLVAAKMAVQPRGTWYQSTLFWGCLSLAVAAVFTVVAAMKRDVRGLLIFAWPFLAIAAWEFASYFTNAKKWRILATALVAVVSALGLYVLSGWLRIPAGGGAHAIISTSKTLVIENDYRFDVTIRVHYVGSREIQANETLAFLWNDKKVQPSTLRELGFTPGDTEEISSSVRVGPSDRTAFDTETGKLTALLTIEYPTGDGTNTRYTFEGRVHPHWNQLDALRNGWSVVRQP
jgi:hypothetical protein